MIAESMPFNWEEMGIAGLAVAGSFWLMWQLIKRNDTAQKELRDEHREERGEWLKASNEHSEKVSKALDSLSEAIRKDADKR